MKLASPFGMGRSARGFSLIEILAVLVVIAIMTAIAIPLMKGPSRGIEMGSSAELLKGELLLARQQAQTLNGPVEVRFFQKTATDPYTAYQIFTVESDGTTRTASSKVRVLPQKLILPADAALCPLLTESLVKGTQTDGPAAVQGWNYSALTIRPSGEFSDVDRDKAFVTMIDENAPKVSGNLPANYAVVRVEPLTGLVSVTRP